MNDADPDRLESTTSRGAPGKVLATALALIVIGGLVWLAVRPDASNSSQPADTESPAESAVPSTADDPAPSPEGADVEQAPDAATSQDTVDSGRASAPTTDLASDELVGCATTSASRLGRVRGGIAGGNDGGRRFSSHR